MGRPLGSRNLRPGGGNPNPHANFVDPEFARRAQAKGQESRRKKKKMMEEVERQMMETFNMAPTVDDGTPEAFRNYVIEKTRGGKVVIDHWVNGLKTGSLTTEGVNVGKTLLAYLHGRPAQAKKQLGADPRGTTVAILSFDKKEVSTLDGQTVNLNEIQETVDKANEPDPDPTLI